MSNDREPVTVLEAADVVELDLARNLLEQAGIPYAVRGHTSAFLGAYVGAYPVGPQALEVMPEHAARARAVLAEAWGTEEGDPEESTTA